MPRSLKILLGLTGIATLIVVGHAVALHRSPILGHGEDID